MCFSVSTWGTKLYKIIMIHGNEGYWKVKSNPNYIIIAVKREYSVITVLLLSIIYKLISYHPFR